MSQFVQLACPGCKNRLRIPAEWLSRPMRCKHCGMVIQAKAPTAAKQTPAPATRKESVAAAPVARAEVPRPSAAAAAPVALPVAQAVNSAAFTDLHVEEESTSRRKTRRRRQGGGWKGPALACAVFLIAGFLVYLNWERLAALLPPDEDAVAQNSGKNDGGSPPTKKATTTSSSPKTNKEKSPTGNAPTKKSTPPKDPTKTPSEKKEVVRNDPNKRPSRTGGNLFPRRALIISVHDYLYANPIQNGMPGAGSHNLNNLLNAINLGLHVPLNQMAHLSDDASPKYGARAPTKTVIEQSVTKFLDTARPQDRILLLFVGHSVETDDNVYLAPIEGELDRAGTLIPLKWFYEQLSKCKARQKVLILDTNRFNRTFGQERPGGEEMGPKLDAMLKEPPAGVQVWSSCSPKQHSYANDDYPMGIFLDCLLAALQQGGNGKIQKVDDPLTLDHYVEAVNKLMHDDLSKRKLEQVSRLIGKEAESGAAYDPNQPPAPDALTCLAPPPAGVETNKMLVESVLDQIGMPPIKVTHEMALRYDALPPFSVDALKKYEGGESNPDSPLRKAVKNGRAVLWALYPGEEPKDLRTEVSQMRGRIHVQLNVLKEGYRAPGGGNAEKAFKDRVENDERKVALMMRGIEDALEELQAKAVTDARDSESKRWQANYDLVLARVQLEYAYLFEYQSMLGSMRKEFPPLDPELHNGWKLASTSRLQGDSNGKKAAKAAQKLLEKIIKDNAGSPWEVLAKREKLTNLGLEWQPASRVP